MNIDILEVSLIKRVCVGCRELFPVAKLIRLTVDPASAAVVLNGPGVGKPKINGRSAYFCRSQDCFNAAAKGTRLKFALTGRQVKSEATKRKVFWPLESQLIKDILKMCTEPEKTCQNTRNKEA